MKWFIGLRDVHRCVDAVFYQHGMFCASHPFAIISMVITIAFVTCYPLFNLPLPGNAPLMHSAPKQGFEPPTGSSNQAQPPQSSDYDRKTPRWLTGAPEAYVQQVVVKSVVTPWQTQRLIQTDAFRGPLSSSFSLVQHIAQLKINTQHGQRSVDDYCVRVSESSGVTSELRRLLPQYNCLLISPANFWRNDRTSFDSDGEIIKNIFKKRTPGIDGPPSFKDVLFGVAHADTGVKKFYMRNRQRVISYAVTIVLREYEQTFIDALEARLTQLYTTQQAQNQHVNSSSNTVVLTSLMTSSDLVHVHYKLQDWVEYAPLIITYGVLFMYIYFVVRKIEMVKSKWGLALSAVAMVIASLLMSMSICLFFGLNPSLNGSEILPYLVMMIGLENVLVVTKSVVSTPVHLDVKLRVAQGISKEGWYMMKHLFTELAILAVGFLTFVPAIQEFCLLAVVGLFTDFFLQMVFFTTVLSVDIRRMELFDLHKQSVQQSLQHPDMSYTHFSRLNSTTNTSSTSHVPTTSSTCPAHVHAPVQSVHASMPHRPVMALRIDTGEYLHELVTPPPSPTSTAPSHASTANASPVGLYSQHQHVPRRVRLFNAWARTRVFQKLMMLCTVVWIGLIVHKAGIWQHLTNQTLVLEPDSAHHTLDVTPLAGNEFRIPNGKNLDVDDAGDNLEIIPMRNENYQHKLDSLSKHEHNLNHILNNKSNSFENSDDISNDRSQTEQNEGILHHGDAIQYGGGGDGHNVVQDERELKALLKHEPEDSWRKLTYQHWPTLFSYYNISLAGKYITMLPSMQISIPIATEDALAMRHPSEPHMVSQLSRYYNYAAKYYETEDVPHGSVAPSLATSYHHPATSFQGEEDGDTPPQVAMATNKTLTLELILRNLAEWPRTRLDLVAHVLLALITCFILVYLVFTLYQCACPKYYHFCLKDYGKWRSSWYRTRQAKHRRTSAANYYQQIRESLPLVLHGHTHEVECIAGDGPVVVSSCLGGYIRVWESSTGECRTLIRTQRKGTSRSSTDSELNPSESMERGGYPGTMESTIVTHHSCQSSLTPSHTQQQGPVVNGSEAVSNASRKLQHSRSLYSGGASIDHSSADNDLAGERFHSSTVRSRKRHPSKHTRYKSADLSSMRFEDIAPDLSGKIATNFNAQEKKRKEEERKKQEDFRKKEEGRLKLQREMKKLSSSRENSQSINSTSSQHSISSSQPSNNVSYSNNSHLSSQASPALCTSVAESNSPLTSHQHSLSQPQIHAEQQTNIPDQTRSFSFPSAHDIDHMSTINQSGDSSLSQSNLNQSASSLQNVPFGDSSKQDPAISPYPVFSPNANSQSLPIPVQSPANQNQKCTSLESSGYDFSRYIGADYEEHKQFLAEKKVYLETKQNRSASKTRLREEMVYDDYCASLEFGESPGGDSGLEVKDAVTSSGEEDPGSAVWCLACQNDVIVAGCGSGAIEFWDGLTGELKFEYCKNHIGVTHLCFVGNRVIAARLNGSIDFLELEFSSTLDVPKPQSSSRPSRAQKRGHRRMPSSHSMPGDVQQWDDIVDCVLIGSLKAHQRSITFLLCQGPRLISASQDYTLKVFGVEGAQCVYTLYGHKGSITALVLDKSDPGVAISGGEEGAVRLWDLNTGACVHKLQGHAAPVTCVTCTRSHVISAALDDRLCIWSRPHAHLLHWIQLESGFCNCLGMLTNNLMVSGAQGCLYLWDVAKGEVLRIVELGHRDHCHVTIRQLLVIDHNVVVCDYGNELRVITFPAVLEKAD